MARRSAAASTPEPAYLSARTCVGCRRRAERADLLRVIADHGRLVPDPRRLLPGRGAHLHPSLECFALAERRRSFTRALRVTGGLDTMPVAEYLRQVAPGWQASR